MKKVIALFLCCALVVPFCLPATAEALSFGYSDQKTEVISKREVYSKTYLLPDGTYEYVSYAEPIHYKDSAGAYVEINNEVTDAVKRDGYKYSNTSNAWNAYFSEKLNNSNAVMLTSGEYDISFSFVGQTGTAAVTKATAISRNNSKDALATYYQNISADNRAVIYSDVIENVDIAYTVKTGALKEDIILRKKQAANTFKFRLTTNGLTLRESGDTLALFTAAGKEVFAFAPLYMEDANGKRSEKVALTYTNVKNGYELTITADAEFLNAADTVYPVVIDPSVMVTGSGDTYDTCADQQYPTSNYYLSENLWTGGALGTNAMRTYIKFDLPSGISYNQIISASIYLRKKEHQTPTVRAYILTESWSSSTLTWNAMPAYDSTVCSQVAVNSVGDWYGLNITTLLQCWLYGSYANNGVVIKEPSEISSGQKTKFYSSDAPSPNKPELVINYSPYYGSRPYQSADGLDVNCMIYAMEFSGYIDDLNQTDPTINKTALFLNFSEMNGLSLQGLENYFREKAETWMTNYLGSSNWGSIQTYDSDINQNWYRVVFRVGFTDLDGDNVFDYQLERFDYHWWYQTSTGNWADKQGGEPSVYRMGTKDLNPVDLAWVGEEVTYNSVGVFYQIRDIREVDWS